MSTTRPARRTAAPPAPPSTAARFAARARAARRQGRRPLVVGALVVALLVALAAFGYAGPALVVREVAVAGVSDARAEQVLAAARAPLGVPLAQVDTGALEARVRSLPFVAGVRVGRHWPSTLDVVVSARTPAAVVPAAGGGYQVVDPDAVPFAAAARRPAGVPVLKMALTPATRPAALAALAVLAALPPDVRAGVSAVSAGSPDDVRLTVGDTTVVWGSADRSERKAAVYGVLRHTKATVYDLSSPDTPVLR